MGFIGKLRRFADSAARWLLLDICKITAWPSFTLFFRTKRYYFGDRPKLRGPGIIISNHASVWEPLVIIYLFFWRRIRFLATDTLFKRNRFFAWLLTRMGCIVINRERLDMPSIAEMTRTLRAGGVVGVFPEGRLSPDGSLQPFKSGAAMIALATGAPVTPVYIDSDDRIYRRKYAMIGETIDVRSLCGGSSPSLREIEEISGALRGRLEALKQRYESIKRQRGV